MHNGAESDVGGQIAAFLAQERFAVVGASPDRAKYGNKCLRAVLQSHREVVAVHPRETEVEGVPAYPSLAAIPVPPQAVSVITPPRVTEAVLAEAASLGILHVWLQPGAEDAAVLARAAELGLDVIAGGPCLLVALHFRDI
jgi:predicted CoA-binding protein